MACVGDSVLTEYDGSKDDSDNQGTTTGSYGQSFQIPNDADVCGMSWYGGRGTVGTQPGTYKIELLSGSISGTVIATTGSVSTASLNLWNAPAWIKDEFTSTVALTGGVTYYLKMTALTGSGNDVVRWYSDSSSPNYTDGVEYRGTATFASRDKNFRVHGVEGGGGTVLPRFLPHISL